MEISPLRLFLLLLYSFLFGGIVGILHDFHRLVRIFFGIHYSSNFPKKLYEKKLPLVEHALGEKKDTKAKQIAVSVLIFFQDLLLFSFAAIGVVVLNYYFNDGQLRLYTIASLIMGFLLYYFTVGRIWMLLGEWVVFFLRAALTMLLFLISYPIRRFVEFLGRNVKKTKENLKKTIAIRRKRVYNKNKVRSVLKDAEQGFLNRPFKR